MPIVYYNLYVRVYVALCYPRRFVMYVIVAPPILRLRKNSNSRVIQILIKRMRKQ